MSELSPKADKKDFLSIIIGIYVVLIGIGLPLVVKDKYFDILIVKYRYYYTCTILMLVLVVGYFVTVRSKHAALFFKEFSLKKVLKSCSIVDYSILVYLIVAMLSTISSDYRYESFWGNEGRYTGLFLIILYVASYFCVSRFMKFKSWYVDLILAAGLIVCVFGITDYFKLDIFRFKVGMIPKQMPIFTSTIGNVNTYTAYVGILVAIATVLYTTDRQFKNMLWHYFCMVIGFFAIIMGVSDNAYLSLGTLFGILPLYLFKNKKGIQKYIIILATFLSVIQCIDWINTYFGDKVLGIDSAFNLVIKFHGFQQLIVCLWGIVILWNVIDYRRKSKALKLGNLFIYLWLVILFLSFIAVMYALYDCNVANNTARYGKLTSYLLFNDDWGTHRGYIWRKGMECYLNLSTWKKVVGFGPETFGILVMQKTANNPYKELFDSAHNEYLHMLTTVGIAGLTSYLIFIFGYIRDILYYKRSNPYFISIMFGVMCYSVQAFVNLNLPCVTPVFWLLMGIGAVRQSEGEL